MASTLFRRINAIDQLRGIVMVIMALDHTRDLFHSTSITDDPLNLETTTPLLFFTRWITHLCAPTFVFLSGVSIYLQKEKYRDTGSLRRKLLIRGAWLILLELTIVNFGIWFDIHFSTTLFQVIGAIGVGFIITALLLNIPERFLLILGLLLLITNQWIQIPGLTAPVFQQYTEGRVLFIGYPPLPWLAIMLTGLGMAPYFRNTGKSAAWFARAGLIFILSGTVIRAFTQLGDPGSWSKQTSVLFTFFSFIRVEKYPPSLVFTLFTLGISFLIYAGLKKDIFSYRLQKIFEVYGAVPLFYYVLHWYLIHSILMTVLLISGYSFDELNFGPFGFGRPKIQPDGYSLAIVYLVWICVVILLYPACARYRQFKQDHPRSFLAKYL